MSHSPAELRYFREEGSKIAAEIARNEKYLKALQSVDRPKKLLIISDYVAKIGYKEIPIPLLMNVIASLQEDQKINLGYDVDWLSDKEASEEYEKYYKKLKKKK
jgi:hypothetical protein